MEIPDSIHRKKDFVNIINASVYFVLNPFFLVELLQNANAQKYHLVQQKEQILMNPLAIRHKNTELIKSTTAMRMNYIKKMSKFMSSYKTRIFSLIVLF